MNRAEKLKVAMTYIERLAMHDVEGLQAVVSDNMVWHFTGPSLGIPDLQGKAGVKALVESVSPGWEAGQIKMNVKQDVVDGDQVVLEADVRGFMRDGRYYENCYLMWFEISEGLVHNFRATADTQMIENVLLKTPF